MGKYEPLDLVEAAFIGHGSVGIYATVIFDGRIDVDRLADAVLRVGPVVPETLCRIDVRRMRFLPIPAPDIVSEIPRHVETGFDWDPTTDTQVKILVGHGPVSDSMVVGMTHVVTDGIGLEQYVSLLEKAYNGNLTILNNVRSIDSILATVRIGEPTRGELAAVKLSAQSLGLPDAGNERICRRVTIPAGTMDSIHDKARKHGVTLNDVFMTACVRVVSRILHLPFILLPCPVDLRPFGDVGPLTVANLSGLYMSSYAVGQRDSFSETMGSVHREIAELRARNRSMAAMAKFIPLCRMAPVWLARWMVRQDMMIPAIVYSNFGSLEPLQFGGTRAAAYYVTGGYRKNSQLGLSVSSYKGATSFVHSLIGDEEGADAAEAVIRQIVQECESWLDPIDSCEAIGVR